MKAVIIKSGEWVNIIGIVDQSNRFVSEDGSLFSDSDIEFEDEGSTDWGMMRFELIKSSIVGVCSSYNNIGKEGIEDMSTFIVELSDKTIKKIKPNPILKLRPIYLGVGDRVRLGDPMSSYSCEGTIENIKNERSTFRSIKYVLRMDYGKPMEADFENIVQILSKPRFSKS